jgi:excinuclease ABC subunit A
MQNPYQLLRLQRNRQAHSLELTKQRLKKLAHIHIEGAKVHNLRNVRLTLPREQLIVVSGVSGSGKSSLVFDTLYAEGHRRYVESLSAYARQFLSRMQKPDVERITGISPAIAIEQRTSSGNPRSTVGSVTEMYDYLRLLFARIGHTISPASGTEVTCHTVTDVVNHINQQTEDTRAYILAPMIRPENRSLRQELTVTLQKGFSRVWVPETPPNGPNEGLVGEMQEIEDILSGEVGEPNEPIFLLIDRVVVDPELAADEDFGYRLADSIQTAFNEGFGRCQVWTQPREGQPQFTQFSEHFEADGQVFERPNIHFFNYNNPFGVCPTCQGFGSVMGYDTQLIVPNPSLSVKDGAIALWAAPSMVGYQQAFLRHAPHYDFPIHRAYADLTEAERKLLWEGNPSLAGIRDTISDLEAQNHKIQARIYLSRFRSYVTCPDCNGSRLRKETQFVKLGGFHIGDLLLMPLDNLKQTIDTIAASLTDYELQVAGRLLQEIRTRVGYLTDVGLGYLTLNRKSNTLSGGETQRIQLANSLGSSLVGSLYILDEPSIGLHARDTQRLIGVLHRLRRLGNTVIVVEHDEAILRQAEFVVDVGPLAGEHGGEIVYSGPPEGLLTHPDSLTGQYLSGRRSVPLPPFRRTAKQTIGLRGVSCHNIQGLDVDIPLEVLTVVTGVSGSGKTTLVREVLYPAIARHLGYAAEGQGRYRELTGAIGDVQHIEMVDQQALGRNLRSNPVTYSGAYDGIRELFAEQPAAKAQSLRAAHFSFNVDGGRCETCSGEGVVTVEMQFLPDIKLTCETCGGKRFKQHVLEVTIQDKSIYDVLQMTITEAVAFFAGTAKITSRLEQLAAVGLGYLRLGQSTSTLSGGEAQRLKLASYLARQADRRTLYIFDEPTTGLHFHDIRILLEALQRLVAQGHTVLIIEHNPEVIKCADWILDLGPEGGNGGGQLVFAGTPEGLAACEASHTGRFLAPYLEAAPTK